MSTSEMDITILINIASFLVAGLGFFLALVAVAIALWQVRGARRVAKVEGEIIALEAFLKAELVGKHDKETVEKLLELIFHRVEQLGAQDILKEMKIILER